MSWELQSPVRAGIKHTDWRVKAPKDDSLQSKREGLRPPDSKKAGLFARTREEVCDFSQDCRFADRVRHMRGIDWAPLSRIVTCFVETWASSKSQPSTNPLCIIKGYRFSVYGLLANREQRVTPQWIIVGFLVRWDLGNSPHEKAMARNRLAASGKQSSFGDYVCQRVQISQGQSRNHDTYIYRPKHKKR
jgi:hypothetical protein